MSVATQLGLEQPDGDLLGLACARWPGWIQSHPVLDVCPDLPALPALLRQMQPEQVNDVLLQLAQLGAVDGGDDSAATGALLWLLLPGAIGVAHDLAPLSQRVDELVAAQLWICARTVSWRKGVRVASTVLRNTRREVLADLGLRAGARRVEIPMDVEVLEWVGGAGSRYTDQKGERAKVLGDIFDAALSIGAVSVDDCELLVQLAQRAQSPRAGRGSGGLTSRTSAAAVAAERGISRPTVARRVERTLQALRASSCTTARSA